MKLGTTISVLRMFDEDKTREFYLEFLGFKQDWEHRFCENSPLYTQISREGCVLHLSGHFGDGSPGATVRIETEGLEDFAASLRAKDYKHSKPGCTATDWGTLETGIKDPSGNNLIFWQRREPAGD